MRELERETERDEQTDGEVAKNCALADKYKADAKNDVCVLRKI